MFDSGVGGLTVARAVLDLLPREEILYIGDTKHGPYGPRPIAEVRDLAIKVMDELVDAGVKLLVIACNTATAAVLHDARERYAVGRGVPVVEVIHPAARSAARVTRNGKVGVIATHGTVESGAYADALEAVPGIELVQQACPRFVELAEIGVTTGPQVLGVAEEYLASVKEAGVDTLVLGCTHYPLLLGPISYVMGQDVTLVTSSEETAKDTYRALAEADLLRSPGAPDPVHQFRATGNPEAFTALARRFLGPEVDAVRPQKPAVPDILAPAVLHTETA
ncbi:glutamate racemase [Actinomyces trachealis]|uniref:glutamate racemase n=1 Tax=Actinomyces trachealis TaxID=2763540 RepID=UPI001C550B81|nr:glutamate racemase [Actinomyces trachealis]